MLFLPGAHSLESTLLGFEITRNSEFCYPKCSANLQHGMWQSDDSATNLQHGMWQSVDSAV